MDPRPVSPVQWLLTKGTTAAALTQTGALSRALVRETALIWPDWWDADLFGPPHREADVPPLTELRLGIVRLRLMRRRGRNLHTTKRGRELLGAPDELAATLAADMGSDDRFGRSVWVHLYDLLAAAGADGLELFPGAEDELLELVNADGWRTDDGLAIDWRGLSCSLHTVRCRAEAYGFIRQSRGERRLPVRVRLTDSGVGHPPNQTRAATTGSARASGPLPAAVKADAESLLVTYCATKVRAEHDDQLRIEYTIRGKTVTIYECRPLWHERLGPEWTRSRVCTMTFDPGTHRWTLYALDRNDRRYDYPFIYPAPDLQALLKELDDDPTCIFWG